MSKLLAIVGPTASGKTELGLRLAQEQNAEIISVDARQVYKYLSVGTAKPRGQWEMVHEVPTYLVEGIPYHMVDILDPDKHFSAADFVQRAEAAIAGIEARGKKPILVGGTGFYFKALTEGLAPLPKADAQLRARLKKIADEKGRARLHLRLQKVDPAAAQKIPANNIQRVIRALEVYELTGKPISEWHRAHQKKGRRLEFIGLDPGRGELARRIEARCRAMLDGGMVEETRKVLGHGYPELCPALSGLGYPEVIAYMKGTLSKETCLALLIQETRQYAKRQMTYFRHQLPVQWQSASE